MRIPTTWLSLAGIFLVALINADTSVQIFSKRYNQFITSSILNWIPDTHYSASKDLVIGGFEIVESDNDPTKLTTNRPIFICRAMHNGMWVAGGQKVHEKRCTVTSMGNVKTYDHYQLLENVDGAARISWTDWNKYAQAPGGAVATDKLYIARYPGINDETLDKNQRGQTYYIGTVNSEDMLGTIKYANEMGEEASTEKGQLLVEIEPIAYELTNVKFITGKSRSSKPTPRILATTTIINEGNAPATMAEAITYSYVKTSFFGQGHAMLNGLNTSITLQNKEKMFDINWGTQMKSNQTSVKTVEIYLEPGTAVNVTLSGSYLDTEIPYTGKLFSRYEDGATTNPRMISGAYREITMTDVHPEYGPIYYPANYTLAPTTAPPSTTTMRNDVPTTTYVTSIHEETTRRRQPTDNNELDNDDNGKNDDVNADDDDNGIVVKPPEVSSSGMQSDDGGPLSLEDKPHGSSARPTFLFHVPLMLASLYVAYFARYT